MEGIMNTVISFSLTALMGIFLARLLLRPLRLLLRAGIRGLGGLLCLGLVDSVAGITGLMLPINAVTVLTVGFLGLPGMAAITLLELAA